MNIFDSRESGPKGPIYGYEPPVTAQMDEDGGGVARAVAGLGQRHAEADREDDYPEDLLDIALEGHEEWDGEEGDEFEFDEWSDEDYTAYHAGHAGGLGKLGAWAGALTSVALVAGLGIWGYDLAMRDLHGVPVVQALEGPMRVAPEDPEGIQVAHQGLAVNEVQAEGSAAPVPDTLALAPAPADLAAEDVASVEAPIDDGLADIDFDETDFSDPDAVRALADSIIAGARPIEEALQAPALVEQTVASQVAEIAEVAQAPSESGALILESGGVAASPRPAARPARRAAAADAALTDVQVTSSGPAGEEVDPGTIQPGTHLVQVGAFPSAELARTEWARLEGRFGPYFEGKRRLVIEASSGGSSFYRLRAVGFASMADARGFCSALVAGKADCIPVTTR